ncbi:DUF4180 domain-containing protein [Maritalea myrionectae]|uniref:DUF4180 domain-containing protein n=1 Tax=Maritalea myrionectae TaxID=454601 RepID=UPI000414E29D|nr:DUF4180 domain-containing protein [Maritalea myrionectae]
MTASDQIYAVPADHPPMAKVGDFMDHIGNAGYEGKTILVLPKSTIDPTFFDLRSGLAGEVTQKLVNYHLKCAIIGDFEAEIKQSNALRDYIYECNRGDHIQFVAHEDEIKF